MLAHVRRPFAAQPRSGCRGTGERGHAHRGGRGTPLGAVRHGRGTRRPAAPTGVGFWRSSPHRAAERARQRWVVPPVWTTRGTGALVEGSRRCPSGRNTRVLLRGDRGISPAREKGGGGAPARTAALPVSGAVGTWRAASRRRPFGEGAAATRSAMTRAGGLPGCRGRAPRHFARSWRWPGTPTFRPLTEMPATARTRPHAPSPPNPASHAPPRARTTPRTLRTHRPHAGRAPAPGRHSRGPSRVGGLQ